MNFFRYLLGEEYYKQYENTEIMVNPTPQELLKYFSVRWGYHPPVDLRWTSNWKLKRIYVWDAEYIHPDVMETYPELMMNCLVRGTAELQSNGKLQVNHDNDITTKLGIKKPIYKHALDYLKLYFNGDIVQQIYDRYDNDVAAHGEDWLHQWWW
jgi:hypothetical protein